MMTALATRRLVSHALVRAMSTGGKKTGIASAEVLQSLHHATILDVRDPDEVAKGKGGPPSKLPGSFNVPLNHDGVSQHERPTTAVEFLAKIEAAGLVLPEDTGAAIITHCGSGGRGGRAEALLRELGFDNVHNGGSPSHISEALRIGDLNVDGGI